MPSDIAELIAAKAAALPFDKQMEALRLIDELARQVGQPQAPVPRHQRRLKDSVVSDLPTVTREDIAEARREMWGEYIGDTDK